MLGRLGQDDFILPLVSWTEDHRGFRQFDSLEVTTNTNEPIRNDKNINFQFSGYRDGSGILFSFSKNT